MSLLYSWITMEDYVLEKSSSKEDSNQSQSTHLKCIFGHEFQAMGPLPLLHSKESWAQHVIVQFYKQLYSLLSTTPTLMDTDFSRTMTRNTPATTQRTFCWATLSNWWRTPAESPNLNPIENVWGSLRYFLRHEYKPRNLETLVAGIKKFWKSMTPEICMKYIGHLQKVMPKVVKVESAARGYKLYTIHVAFNTFILVFLSTPMMYWLQNTYISGLTC